MTLLVEQILEFCEKSSRWGCKKMAEN